MRGRAKNQLDCRKHRKVSPLCPAVRAAPTHTRTGLTLKLIPWPPGSIALPLTGCGQDPVPLLVHAERPAEDRARRCLRFPRHVVPLKQRLPERIFERAGQSEFSGFTYRPTTVYRLTFLH